MKKLIAILSLAFSGLASAYTQTCPWQLPVDGVRVINLGTIQEISILSNKKQVEMIVSYRAMSNPIVLSFDTAQQALKFLNETAEKMNSCRRG